METMANKMRLIDGNEALRMMRNSQHDTPCTDNAGKNVWKVAHDCAISCVEACSTVIAYTEEQVASILQQSDQLRSENQALEKECAWLKSCLNCKIRRECPRHCGKVVHGCDHWEYGYSTVDAVEVVRCKDCKHMSECRGETLCDNPMGIFGRNTADDFCSHGERREGE